MDKTFHIDGDFLQEDARMERPSYKDYDNGIAYNNAIIGYNAHIASLGRYPLGSFPGAWGKTEGIIEQEFVIESGCAWVNPRRLPRLSREESTLLRSIKEVMGCTCPEIYKSRGMAAPDCAECNYAEDIAAHLLRRFNITNK